jgi:hypothetical protein
VPRVHSVSRYFVLQKEVELYYFASSGSLDEIVVIFIRILQSVKVARFSCGPVHRPQEGAISPLWASAVWVA